MEITGETLTFAGAILGIMVTFVKVISMVTSAQKDIQHLKIETKELKDDNRAERGRQQQRDKDQDAAIQQIREAANQTNVTLAEMGADIKNILRKLTD